VLAMLDNAILDGRLPHDVVVLVRHHPLTDVYTGDATYSDNIIFDNSKTLFEKGKTYLKILKNETDHLADSLYHAGVTINTASTISVDAALFDTPIINIVYDGWEKKPLHKSVKRLYMSHHSHYQPIIKSGGVQLAHSFDEMVDLIKRYLENLSLDSEGRKKIVKEHCFKLDDKAGKRIAEYILASF